MGDKCVVSHETGGGEVVGVGWVVWRGGVVVGLGWG